MGWKKRLIKERDELQSRLDRLSVFIVGFSFAKLDQRTKSLLRIQHGLMQDYLAVLRKLFKNPCSQAELNKIVPFGFSLQRQKMVFFLPSK